MEMNAFENSIQHRIDSKTKPLGSLGKLEKLAFQIANVQQTLEPQLTNPSILVFAADHGIAHSGVSAYPSSVTAQMVLNFLKGGAAINIFSRQNKLDLKIIDAGVDFDFPENSDLIDFKIRKGTSNFLYESAMTEEELKDCFEKAGKIVDEVVESGCNIIGFGEMGIANTSSASMLMSCICQFPIEECVGKGTGLTSAQWDKKIKILQQAQQNHTQPKSVEEALMQFGGFEIAQICGAMLSAFERNMLIMVDGFIITSAFLCAHAMNPKILDNAIFCHKSNEKGHEKMLEFLGVDTLLDLDLRLGEGTGCAIALPIIESSIQFFNEMASFETAGVNRKEESL